jgi:hypothetical protein
MHRRHRSSHEHIHLQVHAVSSRLFTDSRTLFNIAIARIALGHVADGGSLAEEVIATIRTAQAFGTQKKLSQMYDKHVEKAYKVDLRAAIVYGFSLSSFFFVIYGGYALSTLHLSPPSVLDS